jgi:hypothetical protein
VHCGFLLSDTTHMCIVDFCYRTPLICALWISAIGLHSYVLCGFLLSDSTNMCFVDFCYRTPLICALWISAIEKQTFVSIFRSLCVPVDYISQQFGNLVFWVFSLKAQKLLYNKTAAAEAFIRIICKFSSDTRCLTSRNELTVYQQLSPFT